MNFEQAKYVVENWNEDGLPTTLKSSEAGFILRLEKQGEIKLPDHLRDELEDIFDDGFGA